MKTDVPDVLRDLGSAILREQPPISGDEARAAAGRHGRSSPEPDAAMADDVDGGDVVVELCPRDRRRWPRITVGASVVAVLLVAVLVISRIGHPATVGTTIRLSPSSIAGTVDTTSTPTTAASDAPSTSIDDGATAVAPEPSSLFSAPPSALVWQTVEPSSLGTSSVHAVVSGPGGFVAIGSDLVGAGDGTDPTAQRERGRVWFSEDGTDWGEASPDLFDGLSMGWWLAATSDAYFVLAFPTDAGTTPTGGWVFTSTDGRNWTRVADNPVQDIYAAGDVLIGMMIHPDGQPADIANLALGTLIASTDGSTWQPVEFPDGDPSPMTSFGPDPVRFAGRYYLTASSPTDANQLWTSTDGLSWRQLAPQTAGGYLLATDRTLVRAGATSEQDCAPFPDHSATPEQITSWQRQVWECTGDLTMAVSTDAVDWQALTSSTPWATTEPQPPLTLGHTMVRPVLSPDADLTLLSSTDGRDWSTVDDVHVDTAPDGTEVAGSPRRVLVATNQQTAVVIVPIQRRVQGPGCGCSTTVIVGTARAG